MEQTQTRHWCGRRLLFFLKWIVLPLALVTILPLAALTLYEMTREVPVPESFQRFEAEQTSPGGGQDVAALAYESIVEGSAAEGVRSEESVSAQVSPVDEKTDLPEFQSEPLIPISEDRPDDVAIDELQKLNDAFADLERRFAEYESNKEKYSFKEASDHMLPLYREALIFQTGFNQNRYIRDLRRGGEGRTDADAANERAIGLFRGCNLAFVELGVRHKKWDIAGMFSNEWDEKVYCYRKCGATRGSLFIAIELTRRGAGRVVGGIGSAIDSIRRR